MAEKNKGAIDPVAIRELISQGIPMKKKESEMIPSPGIEEVDTSVPETRKEEVLEEPQLPIRTRRKNTAKGDYISLFMQSTSPKSCRTNCRKSSSSSERGR